MPRLSQGARLELLLRETRGRERFQDLQLVMRRPLVALAEALPKDARVTAGKVRLRLLEDGAAGALVPVKSEVIGESAEVAAGAAVELSGRRVGTFAAAELLRAGGTWDHFLGDWQRDAAGARTPAGAPLVLDVQESQVAYTSWFSDQVLQPWHRGEPLQVSASLAMGGRRAGKTFLLNMLLWALLLDTPLLADGSAAIGWQISVTFREKEEIDRQVKDLIPEDWYTFAAADNKYTLAHGPTVTNLSARNPASLRRGRGDVMFLNEAQKMPRRAFVNALPATADRGGILLMAANPPTEEDQHGEWIYELYDASQEARLKGEEPPVLVHDFDWTQNQAIDRAARARVAAAIRLVDPSAAEADEHGVVKPVGQRAMWEFRRADHVRDLPEDFVDITEEFTASKTRVGYPFLAGADFQLTPYHAVTIYKVTGTIERPVLWCVDCITTTGDEDDLLDDVEHQGYCQRDILFIGDASGETQDGAHTHREGRTSYAFFAARGWKILPPKVKKGLKTKGAKNPDVPKSLTLTNGYFKDNRLFILPSVEKAILAVKNCKARQRDGGTYPADRKWGHIIDTIRYPTWWAEPPKRAPVQSVLPSRFTAGWRERAQASRR